MNMVKNNFLKENGITIGVVRDELLLNKELEKISDFYMSAYKNDIKVDIELLLDRNKLSDTFVWVVRDTGTHLYEEDKLFIEEDGSKDDYLYFKDYQALVFKITVTKRGRKNVYGSMELLDRKKFTSRVENERKSFKNVHFKVLLNDGSIKEVDLPAGDETTFYTLCEELKVQKDDIKKIYRQKYFN